jgi:UDP-glucose-4-epimerase GalE
LDEEWLSPSDINALTVATFKCNLQKRFLPMRAVLVTGGAGYIGSHVCKALAERHFEPVTVDNLSRGNRWAVKWGPLELADLSDTAALRRIFELYRPSAVMHFAGFAYVGESVEKPLLYYQNNVGGSAALLRVIIDAGIVPVVFSSSCATYGIPESIPIPEEHPQRPINAYGFSKLFVERMLADAGQAHDLRSVSLRYFNAAGADPDGEVGEAHDPEPHLIPRVLAAAHDGTAVTIYGNDYGTADGTCIRDFIHVSDIADAHVCALDYLLSGGTVCALNLANAQGYSVMDVIETARKVSERRIRVEIAPRRPGDPPVLIGSSDRALEVLGWTPRRPRLETQIRDAWNWLQKASDN